MVKKLSYGKIEKFLCFLFAFYLYSNCSIGNKIDWVVDIPKENIFLSQGIRAEWKDSSLSFYSQGLPDSILTIPLHEPFLEVRKGNAKVNYRMASFTFKDQIEFRCHHQSIQKIQKVNSGLQILGELNGTNCNTKYEINFVPVSPRELSLNIKISNLELNRIVLKIGSTPDERIFGLGEQFSHFDFKGKKPFLFTEEQGIGRGDEPITTGANIVAGAGGNEYTTYAPIPHYITTKHRQVFFENTGYSKFDFSKANIIQIEFWDFQEEGGLKANFWIGTNPLELIQAFTAKTGRMPALPNWAYGTIMGLQGGTKKVVEVIQQAKSAGNPVTALWIQDWCGRRVTNFGDQLAWRWYADESLYPNFRQFVKERNAEGIQVLGYVNPFLADTDPKKKGGDSFTNPLLEEAKKKGYLVKDSEGKDYLIQTVGFPAYIVDLTNPEAYKWLKEIIKKNMIGVGLSGWMADFGEWLPYDAVLHSGVSAKVYHNQYPVDWARLNREAIREAGKEGQIVFFTRAGFSYSAKYSTLFWLGDQMVSFQTHDGLPSAVLGLLTSGVSGISLNHSDIGGYTTISNPIKNYHRSKELLLRWSEHSAFSVVYRTHEGNRPLKNWQAYEYTNPEGVSTLSDKETVQRFANMGRLHYALKDYIQNYVKEAERTGLPVTRHPYLHYPEDPNTYSLKYQYLLGEDLMVMPVVSSGKSSVKGYLPRGKWEHIWSGKIWEGPKHIEIPAPIGEPAAFIRLGSKNEEVLRKAIQSYLNYKP